MAKKKASNGGGQSLRKRGLVGLLVPMTAEVRDMVARAAIMSEPRQRSTVWSATVLEAAARAALAAAGLPEKKSKES